MNARDVMAKPIVSIRLGKTIGKIRYPIVDATRQEVIGFTIDEEKLLVENKAILFPLIRGLGRDMVTVQDDSVATPISQLEAIHKQLEDNIQIIGHQIITEDGQLLGTVDEFSFDKQTGKIDTYKMKEAARLIRSEDVISIGSQFIIVSSNAAHSVETKRERVVPAFDGADNFNLNSIFERRQVEFVIGKRLVRNLETEAGQLIASEGDIISEDIITRAKSQGKFTELVMSIEQVDEN